MRVLKNSSILFLILLSSCTVLEEVNITEPGYAIGVIEWYKTGSHNNTPTISFTYTVNDFTNNAHYSTGTHGWRVPSQGNYKTGDQYMVQYDLNNIKTARMLFDYPVKDSTDYKKYVEEFKTNPPK